MRCGSIPTPTLKPQILPVLPLQQATRAWTSTPLWRPRCPALAVIGRLRVGVRAWGSADDQESIRKKYHDSKNMLLRRLRTPRLMLAGPSARDGGLKAEHGLQTQESVT